MRHTAFGEIGEISAPEKIPPGLDKGDLVDHKIC